MLQFIGHGSAFNTELGNTSAYIKRGNTLFLIDCGSSTFDRIMKRNLLEGVEHIHILMTHTHPDHVGSLGDLIFYGYFMIGKVFERDVTVYSPKELQLPTLLRLMGVEDKTYNLVTIDETAEIDSGGFQIQMDVVPVTHFDCIASFGYILHFENRTIYYSGDANEIPTPILDRLNNGEFDFFFQDTCKADYVGNVHLPLRKLDELVNPNVRERVYCMHLDVGFDIERANALGFNVVSSLDEKFIPVSAQKPAYKLGQVVGKGNSIPLSVVQRRISFDLDTKETFLLYTVEMENGKMLEVKEKTLKNFDE